MKISIRSVLQKLKPKVYNWRSGDNRKSFGFLAQDLLKIFPEDKYDLVVKQPDGFYSVNYYQLIPIMVSKINELEKRVEELENERRVHQ